MKRKRKGFWYYVGQFFKGLADAIGD